MSLNIVQADMPPWWYYVPRGDRRVGTCGGDINRAPAHPYTELLRNSARTEIRLRRRRRWQISEKAFRPVPGDVFLPEMSETLQPLPRGEAGGYDSCCRPYGQVFPADVNFCKKLFSCNLSLF